MSSQKGSLIETVDKEKRDVLLTFDNVWTMSQHIVFYYTDAQIQENQANGYSKKVLDALQSVDKKYGMAPNYPHTFDSKESFDGDFEGKWHYYWK